MPRSRPRHNLSQRSNAPSKLLSIAAIPAEAALSFLKDTKGTLTWSVRDLADSLKISARDAPSVIAILQAQGYVKPAQGTDEWTTTPAGESLSGAKAPRFTRESVEQAIAALRERIKSVNQDPNASFRITEAIAFGDFLFKDRARVQPAELGIKLHRRGQADEPPTAPSAHAHQEFLRQLRGKTALLKIRPYKEWMRKRSHLDLL